MRENHRTVAFLALRCLIKLFSQGPTPLLHEAKTPGARLVLRRRFLLRRWGRLSESPSRAETPSNKRQLNERCRSVFEHPGTTETVRDSDVSTTSDYEFRDCKLHRIKTWQLKNYGCNCDDDQPCS